MTLTCRILLVGACALILSACQLDVRHEELTGTWSLTPASSKFLMEKGTKAGGTLIFKSDETFVAEGLPGSLVFAATIGDYGKIVSGRGRWRLTRDQGQRIVNLRFEEMNPSERPLPLETYLIIDRTSRRFFLYYYFDSEDTGLRVEFEKRM